MRRNSHSIAPIFVENIDSFSKLKIIGIDQCFLTEVRQRLQKGESLSRLEQSGVLHALQVLIENAIGKAKHTLKHLHKNVPISAYDAFEELTQNGIIPSTELNEWIAIIGLRNKIVHDYMNIDTSIVLQLVKDKHYDVVVNFLRQPIL